MKQFDLWTDGSCNNNPNHVSHGFGGWAFCVVENGNIIYEDLGFDEKVTSQRMEMEAVIQGLIYMKKNHINSVVTIHSDSAYIINCFKERWYIRWQEMNWDNVKNTDYWQRMLSLYSTKLIKIRFNKVKGHAGIELNERVDFLAGEARKFIMSKND